MESKYNDFQNIMDIQKGSLQNKVDYNVLRQLEEKFEKKLGLLERDIKIKGKKIALLMKEHGVGGDNSASKRSLHEGKNSVDVSSQYSNALMPKLPFMKQGYKIADFGSGYSKLLEKTPPRMSPNPDGSQPIFTDRLAEMHFLQNNPSAATFSPSNIQHIQVSDPSTPGGKMQLQKIQSRMQFEKRESRAHSNIRQGESRNAYNNPANSNKIRLRRDF